MAGLLHGISFLDNSYTNQHGRALVANLVGTEELPLAITVIVTILF